MAEAAQAAATAPAGMLPKLTRTQKFFVGGAGVAVLIFLLLWLAIPRTGDRMTPLFTGLNTTDAAEIVEELEDRGIPYRLERNGTAVLVDKDQVYRTRLSLASQGLPRAGVAGFELMDRVKVGSTDFERRVSYLRALQGELARTIMAVEGVEKARVHLVLPEDSLFIRDQRPASAAVLLGLKPGIRPDDAQINGVVNLVAGSVENLQAEDVTVVDATGRVLSTRNPGTESQLASANFEVQTAFQRELEQGVQRLLEPALGPGNVVTRVTAEMNFDERSVQRTMFEPTVGDQGITRSIQELQETFQGEGTPGRVPGVDGNSAALDVPGYEAAAAAGASSYEKTQQTRNYELNQVTENIRVAPGTVSRLSVAVVVNKNLQEAQREAITRTVSAAIGLDEGRQDQITVIGMPFDTSLADEVKRQLSEGQVEGAEPWRQWVYIAAGALGLLLVTGIVLGMVIARRRRRQAEEALLQQLAEEQRREKESKQTNGRQNGNRVKTEIEQLARQSPDSAVQVIRTWLTEE